MTEYIMDGNKYVQELVRCKDCKHWQDAEEGIVEMPFCPFLGERESIGLALKIGRADDYCSYGERKDNEQ